MKLPVTKLYNPFGWDQQPVATLTWASRVGFDMLVVFNVVAQGIGVFVLLMGRKGHAALPVAAGAMVALFLLMYFYARWMLPMLKRRHVLAVMLLKELGVILLVGFAVSVVALLRWLID